MAASGVRYTVPSTIDPGRMGETQTVRFRVGNVYKDCRVAVYLGEERLRYIKKRIVTPGEMEQVILKKSELSGKTGELRFAIEG